MRLSVRTYFPLPATAVGINYICLSICQHMQSDDVSVRVIVPMARGRGRRPFVRPVFPSFLPYRRLSLLVDAATRRAFMRGLAGADIAYLWSDVPHSFSRALSRRRVTVVREKFNCHKGTAKSILDDAYSRLGLPPGHGITDAMVERERAALELADLVFSPSPMVHESLIENGVPDAKIIDTSFGWEPARFYRRSGGLRPASEFTVLFAGTGCVRKGLHLLLEAWSRARIRGRIVLAGRVLPDIQSLCAHHLNRRDVVLPGHVEDMGALYDSASAFAFPTLEEGGPLVTYEAMAHSLPVVVSPMGAGAVARGEDDSLVLDPYDIDAWASTLSRLAADTEFRAHLGANARQRAEDFTWDRVGARRRVALQERLRPRAAAPGSGPSG